MKDGADMDIHQLCPSGETLWTTYYKNDEPGYIVTSKIGNREYYFLYPIVNGVRGKRLGKAHSPIELENTYMKDFFDKN